MTYFEGDVSLSHKFDLEEAPLLVGGLLETLLVGVAVVVAVVAVVDGVIDEECGRISVDDLRFPEVVVVVVVVVGFDDE